MRAWPVQRAQCPWPPVPPVLLAAAPGQPERRGSGQDAEAQTAERALRLHRRAEETGGAHAHRVHCTRRMIDAGAD